MSRDLWVVRESGAEVQVEWRVERFLSHTGDHTDLSHTGRFFSLHSPSFSLSDAQWFLQMCPNVEECTHLYLCKRFSTSETHCVEYTLGIRSTDGSVYVSIDGKRELKKHGGGGWSALVGVSELRGSRNVLSADGVLTAFATLRLAEPTLPDDDIPRALPLRETHTEEVSTEWKVEGFASLPKEEDFSLDSPTLSFAAAEWCLRVYPYGRISRRCKGWVSLFLRKQSSSSEEQTVAYTLGIRRRNGTPYRLHHGEGEFGTGDERGCWAFIKSSELLDSPNGLVHRGSVTFFCTLRADTPETLTERATPTSSGPSQEEKASQTAPSEEEATAHSSVKNLLEQLKRLVLNGQHADVTFKVNDQTFLAHRVILTTRSPVFFRMFENDMEEKRTGVVTITDFQPNTIKDLLSFLYTGDVSVVTSGNAVEVFKVAHKYDIQDLKDAALRGMTRDYLSPEAFFDAFVLASVYSERELLRAASAFFVENAGSILAAPGWLPFMQDHTVLANELLQQLRSEKL